MERRLLETLVYSSKTVVYNFILLKLSFWESFRFRTQYCTKFILSYSFSPEYYPVYRLLYYKSSSVKVLTHSESIGRADLS